MATTKSNNTAIEKRAESSNTVTVPARQEQAPEAWYTPLVDVIENDEAFVFQADLPGARPDDVDVNFRDGELTIAARVAPRLPAGQNYVWREYGVGHFYRSFNIEAAIDPDGIKAQMKNGVLELYVPKAESARARKIQIQST